MIRIIKTNPLFFAFLFPAVVDGIVTLLGQSPEYWTNRVVNEASPAYYFLLVSPLLFILGAILWFLFWYWAMKRLKEPFNLFLMFVFIAGHSWGSSSWLMGILKRAGIYIPSNQISVITAWSFLVVYFLLISALATYCLQVYFKSNKS